MSAVALLIAMNLWRVNVPDFHVNLALTQHGEPKWAWEWPGPEGGVPLRVVSDPSNSSRLMAAMEGSLWSYDGTQWSIETDIIGMPEGLVAFGSGIFGVFVSAPENNEQVAFYRKMWGGTWAMERTFNRFLCVGEATGPVNYVVTVDTIFKTEDAGQTWTPIFEGQLFDPDSISNIDIDFSPLYPDTVYLAIESGEDMPSIILMKSVDGGATWDTVYTEGSTQQFVASLSDIEVKPDDPDFVVIAGGGQYGPSVLKYSTDGGHTFTLWLESLAQGLLFANDIEFSGDTVFISNILPSRLVRAVRQYGIWLFSTIDTTHMFSDLTVAGNTLYAAFSGGVARFQNGGGFEDISQGLKAIVHPGYIIGPVLPFYYSQHGPMAGGTMALNDFGVYLFREADIFKPNNAVYITHDGGMTWEKKYIPSALIFDVTNAPGDPNYIYASVIALQMLPPDSFVLYTLARSTDGGNTFVMLNPISDSGDVSPFIVKWVSPSNPNVLIGFMPQGQGITLKLSTDGGNTFTDIFTTQDQPIALTGTDTLFFVHTDFSSGTNTIEVSYNSGLSWTTFATIQGNVFDARYEPNGHALYVACMTATGPEIRRYSLDGSFESIPFPTVMGTPLNLSVDGRGRLFMGIQTPGNPGQSIIARYDGSGWEMDTISPFFATEVMATDTLVTLFTVNLSNLVSRDAAFNVMEPTLPGQVSREPTVRLERGGAVLIFSAVPNRPVDVQLFDVTGRAVASYHLMPQTGQASVRLPQNLKDGVYIYRVVQGGREKTGRFIMVK